jgi:hypothetical protein
MGVRMHLRRLVLRCAAGATTMAGGRPPYSYRFSDFDYWLKFGNNGKLRYFDSVSLAELIIELIEKVRSSYLTEGQTDSGLSPEVRVLDLI